MEQSSLSCISQRKRTPRRRKEKPIDHLSELPEPLIAHILSFLDMKDAVRTSVLSKSWKYYWTQVDTIVFHLDDLDDLLHDSEQRLEKFMLFVDHTLMQCTCPKIKKFSLTGCFNPYDYEYTVREFSFRMDELVDKWIDFVLGKKVEVLNLGLKGFEYLIPECFYRSSSLTMLEIDEVGNHYFSPPPPHDEEVEFTSLVLLSFYHHNPPRRWCFHKRSFDVSWNKLQLLSLKSVYVTKKFMDEILLGCPVLETLILDKVGGLYALNITSPSVTELRLLNCSMHAVDNYINLQINAPWVKKLEVSGEFFSFDCELVDVPSLKSANLTLSYCDITYLDDVDSDADDGGGHDLMSHNMIDKLLIPVCDADDLVIGAELLQAVSVFHLIEETSLVLQYKNLTIQSPICIHEVPGIVCLLDSSPNMETLVMRVMPWQCDLSRYEGFKYGHYIEEVFTSFNTVDYLGEQKLNFPSLRNVKIDCREKLDACEENECFELEIAAYIIKHSPFLEKFVILCSESNSSKCGAEYCSILTSKLKVGEKAVQWKLKKMDTTYEFIFRKTI